MTIDSSILGYFLFASPVVKLVMLLLLAASIASWTIIFQRGSLLKWAKQHLDDFEDRFWSAKDLTVLYNEIKEKEHPEGIEKIFLAGLKEFVRLQKRQGIHTDEMLAGAQRAMRVAYSRTMDDLENHLSFLATVGSTSPYVGLFGTVWGIMTAFHSLGQVQQATIAMVAPGISEALVATAMGLFAAIPAVIAYNRFANQIEKIQNRLEAFQEEFSNYLYRMVYSNEHE
ncbi:MAG: protein TolQ [Gammaproteobacteria bacterium]|nr:protein TolQ [Gammaproteobacteria bacterium]